MLQNPSLAPAETDDDFTWTGSLPGSPEEDAPDAFSDEAAAAGAADLTEPAEGSDAALTLEFARNLTRLTAERGLDTGRLAALTVNFGDGKFVEVGSIRDYERGKHRPKQPTLWVLAQALDVMPIVLGPSSMREVPPPTDVLLRKKGSRALRLQKLVELLTDDGRVSTFAALAGMEPAEVYAVASSEVQLTEEQLEPFLSALPRVRRAWLVSGQGESLAVTAVPAPGAATLAVAAPGATTPEPVAPGRQERLPDVFYPAPQAHPLAAPSGQVLSLSVPAVAGAPLYVPLGLGLVAEVDALLLAGAGAVSGFRLLAGAGVVPALTSAEQLERLFHALRGVLDQRAGE